MGTRFILGNLLTGRRILDIPVLTGSWDNRLNVPGSISVTVDLNDEDVQALDLRNTSTPVMTFLGAVEGDQIVEAGPIWSRSYNADKRQLTLTAKGLGSYFAFRNVLPAAAASLSTASWTVEIPDPGNPSATIWVPNPSLTSTWVNLSLGTIIKRLVQQSELWLGGDLPIVYRSDVAGINTRTYQGLDFKPVLEAITDIANVQDGSEWAFTPRWTSDLLGVEWLLETGEPLLTSSAEPLWDFSRPEATAEGLSVDEDGSVMAGLAWQVGGKQADKVLVARASSSLLTSAGYPLLEVSDSSHSSVSEQSTLNSWAAAGLQARARETWSFTAQLNPRDEAGNPAGPILGQYRVGDYATLDLGRWDSGSLLGDPFLPDGLSRHRIIGLSGDEKGRVVRVKLAPRLEE